MLILNVCIVCNATQQKLLIYRINYGNCEKFHIIAKYLGDQGTGTLPTNEKLSETLLYTLYFVVIDEIDLWHLFFKTFSCFFKQFSAFKIIFPLCFFLHIFWIICIILYTRQKYEIVRLSMNSLLLVSHLTLYSIGNVKVKMTRIESRSSLKLSK